MRNRRAALDGLSRILDAGALEELFIGPDDEAAFLYDLLVEAARARSSTYYWEICRTARRRGVTPDYVVDRAVVLLASMAERRRTDLYRILGVPPLSSGETIRQRWLDVAKTSHPDTGGDVTRFRQAKEAYEILRDPDRRAEYEKFWLRALGPFERVAPVEDAPLGAPLPAAAPAEPPVRLVVVTEMARPAPELEPQAPPAPTPGATDDRHAALQAAARLFATRDALDRRLGVAPADVPGSGTGIGALIGRLEAALAPIDREELDRMRGEAERVTMALSALRDQIEALTALKRRLSV